MLHDGAFWPVTLSVVFAIPFREEKIGLGVATVRELYGVMAAEGAVGGFVVASGTFTDDARSFAEGRSIKLVHTELMIQLVKETASGSAASVLLQQHTSPLR